MQHPPYLLQFRHAPDYSHPPVTPSPAWNHRVSDDLRLRASAVAGNMAWLLGEESTVMVRSRRDGFGIRIHNPKHKVTVLGIIGEDEYHLDGIPPDLLQTATEHLEHVMGYAPSKIG
jgi:hypothetical protein